ncbi:flavin monoamine oxidase family protein [Pontivivens insulae]|uniref:Tryptophan 2-monooxygenase n=1 Tax=Pontivivens insulae TaxID=1639689 RepID=A0A2R8AB83_9RHOB|nr:NAD(P)/FAD-dependent oxidoreductase [Pontivivens insulae]RED11356.1 lysine 2-monooxygenase [Pontivivens insulae]SPF29471.1 Tryptophan 2-monooxygenase [Pontivivens insulae]
MSPTENSVTAFGPDFPFDYESWLGHPAGLGTIPEKFHGAKVAVIGAGMAGITAGYELMRMGLHPVFYDPGEIGGRLRSRPFTGQTDIVAELGGMRFPVSSRAFYHYINKLGLETRPFPNPLTEAAGSTVIEIEGNRHYAESLDDLPALYREVAEAYDAALEEGARFSDLKAAIAAKDVERIKAIWDPLVKAWDERTFYDFVVSSEAFQKLSFHHREVFGQVGFGTGGWDSDFPNSMLEILRVNLTELDDAQRFVVGGASKVPKGLWEHAPIAPVHWPHGTTLKSLNDGAPRAGAARLFRDENDALCVTDNWGTTQRYAAVISTCQSWLMTTAIETEEALFSPKVWMALDRTRYMQSSKTFVMTDRAFWRDRDADGREVMSMTLTDRLTRGTYLLDQGEGKPGVICLTYSWMTDALKMLPLPVEKRVELALGALEKIYPDVDIRSHIIGDPITVSWEADPNFLGAFKGALPGHYRYNHRMYAHFMQRGAPKAEKGIFLAGDDVSWTPGWVEGAVSTALNAVWGVMDHLGGRTDRVNPGPGDMWDQLRPVELGD